MDREISLEERTSENGFVKETASFIICDDLRVMPNSLGTSVDLFHELGAKNMEAIEERTVEIGNKELLDLLKCSFLSKTPLTDFILNKKQFLYVYTKHQCQFEIGEVSSNVIRQMVLKVLIRKSDRKILFVEGQEDFADFIFGFLTLPLGGVLHMLGVFLLTLQSLFDFMGNFIKQWILLILSPLMENQILEDVIGPAMYMVTDDLVVTPILSISGVSYLNRSKVRLSDLEQRVINIGLKECLSILKASLISTSALTNGLEKFIMPDKLEDMLAKLISPQSSNVFDAFVKKCNASFLITDDLMKVLPNSLDIFFYLFKNSGIKDVSSVREMSVTIAKDQALDLLKSCLHSKTTLTDLFLEKRFFKTSFEGKKNIPYDLVVTRMSSICVMSLLQSMSIPVSDLAEKVVSIGIKEGVRMLRASLTSTSALTIGLNHLLTKAKEENSYLTERGNEFRPHGFPKGPSMYMVTDDLVLTPKSPISAVSYLNTSQVPLSDLGQRVINIGLKEVMQFLRLL
ncbi:hypothetical protein D0Y65_049004 [Glycine soja]|uniref:Uncharacterized protein n=1 Tax=Glycine soja TaxID=3848 RepID=A0A445FVC9_GLYSO|nr:hypothetical protein D0Y65_049004 [Glycine soja]